MDLFADERASSIKLLKLLFKNILLITIFTIVCLAIGIGITFCLPKKYYAYSVIFPPNSNLGLNILEDPRFGNSLDADQLMQLLESQQISDTIIQMYNLENYYEIDRSEKSWKQKLERKFDQDVSFTKTRYYSVVVSAKMKSAELSANVVNSIVELVDVLRIKIIRNNQLSAFKYAEEQYLSQEILVDSLKKVIYNKKEASDPNNILYNHLLEITKTQYYDPTPFVSDLEMENLVENYVFEREKLTNLKGDYHKAKRLIEKPFSKVFVVNKAIPNYKRISPSFVFNAVVAFMSSFIFIILFVIVRDRFSNLIKSLKS